MRAVREITLSQRRIDVVRQALRGQTDREIAESLFVSARTVSNHLGAVYSTLEVAGRAELFSLLVPKGDIGLGTASPGRIGSQAGPGTRRAARRI